VPRCGHGGSGGARLQKALFATPESVAAAVAYVRAKLTLLADGQDYATAA